MNSTCSCAGRAMRALFGVACALIRHGDVPNVTGVLSEPPTIAREPLHLRVVGDVDHLAHQQKTWEAAKRERKEMVLLLGIGPLGEDDECILRRYQRQLATHGIGLAVFRDMTGRAESAIPPKSAAYTTNSIRWPTTPPSFLEAPNVNETQAQESLLHDFKTRMDTLGESTHEELSPSEQMTLEEGLDISVCSGRFDTASKQYAAADFERASSCQERLRKRPQKSIHSVYLTYWWKHCAPTSDVDYVWIIEKDTVFTGDVSTFFNDYRENHADVLASTLQLVDHRWVWFECHQRTKMASIAITAAKQAVTNLQKLPVTADPTCADLHNTTVDAHEGLLFHQEHVIRYSSRVFTMLDEAISENYVGPGEALVTSLCASRKFLPDCTIYDFAPLAQIESAASVVSNWCWARPGMKFVTPEEAMKTRANTWYHHVNWPKSISSEICCAARGAECK